MSDTRAGAPVVLGWWLLGAALVLDPALALDPAVSIVLLPVLDSAADFMNSLKAA